MASFRNLLIPSSTKSTTVSSPQAANPRLSSAQLSIAMVDSKRLSSRPSSFSVLRSLQTQAEPSSIRIATEAVLIGLDASVPVVSALPRLAIGAFDRSITTKREQVRRVCGRLVTLHGHAQRTAHQLSSGWIHQYDDLISRFTAFAKQYEKRRRALFRIASRVRGTKVDDDNLLEAFHCEIDDLCLQLID